MHRFLLALALIVIVQPAAAQEPDIAVGTVSSLSVNETSFAVVAGSFIQNPAHCPSTDSYRSQRELYYATALTAFTMKTLLRITNHRSECVDGRPKIIGMSLDSDNVGIFGLVTHLDTVEQRVNDLNNQTNQITNQIAQRADQALAQGNQIASKVDQVELNLLDLARLTARDPNGHSLIGLVDSIVVQVGATP
jgi:hypothetical protein